jgi:signal transduction histidine kinase
VRRHAHATEVLILLRATPTEVRLSVQDNGRGFDADASFEGHHGIVGMKERAGLLGGDARVESQPGRGTTMTALVPISEEDR